MKDHECQPPRCEYTVDNSERNMLLSAFSDGLIRVRMLVYNTARGGMIS